MTPPRGTTDAQALAYVEDLEREVLEVLDRRTRSADASASRRVARRVLLDLVGRVTISEIECEGEDARRSALADLDALQLHVSTHGRPVQ